MFSLPNGKITIAQVLLPVSLVAFVLFLTLAFQFTQIMQARDEMKQAMKQQDKPLEDARRLGAQVNALAIGTQNLANNGDKDAKGIIDRLNKLGISVNMPPAGSAAAPSAAEGPAASPDSSASKASSPSPGKMVPKPPKSSGNL